MCAWGSPFNRIHHNHNGCQWGSPPEPTHCSRKVVNSGNSTTHQSSRATFSTQCLQTFPTNGEEQVSLANIACMFYINCQGGPCSHSLCSEAMKLWNGCIQNKVNISVSYLPGCENMMADTLSRHFSQEHKWKINNRILQSVFQWCDFPPVDLIWVITKPQVPTLLRQSLVDTFLITWDTSLLYTFSLIPQAMHKLFADKAYFLLRISKWPRETWYL